MISIRRRISAWMLPGLAIVWALGGIAVYRTYRSAVYASIDSENMTFTRAIRASQRSQGRGGGGGPGRGPVRPGMTDLEVDGLFYQTWNLDGETLSKSANLGATDLPRPGIEEESITRRTVALPALGRVRTVEMAFGAGRHGDPGSGFGPPAHAGGGGGGTPMIVVIARDLSGADAGLKRVLLGIGGAGILMMTGMALLLKLALRNGLQPLDALAAAVAEVDPSSLHARFSTGGEPLELRPIVSRLDRLMDRVEEGFLRERRFGADLAHELRTPIAEMRTKLDLAATWPEERTDELFHAAQEIARRMQRVVDTMLQLANLEGGSGGFPMEEVNLAPIVAGAWKPCEAIAAQKRLIAEMDCAEDVTVSGSPELWKHILANLFSNAVDYTPAGGSIRLSVNETGISLSNTIGGAAIENPDRMFERFWRADGSRSDSHHSGLGLSLVQACALRMNYQATASLENIDAGQILKIAIDRSVETDG